MPRAAAATSYRRKLSRADEGTGSMLIDKHAWRLFPPPMEEFTVLVDGQEFRTRIVAEDSARARPPHQHYHLEAGHFRHLLDFSPGRSVLVRREAPGSYSLEMAD